MTITTRTAPHQNFCWPAAGAAAHCCFHCHASVSVQSKCPLLRTCCTGFAAVAACRCCVRRAAPVCSSWQSHMQGRLSSPSQGPLAVPLSVSLPLRRRSTEFYVLHLHFRLGHSMTRTLFAAGWPQHCGRGRRRTSLLPHRALPDPCPGELTHLNVIVYI